MTLAIICTILSVICWLIGDKIEVIFLFVALALILISLFLWIITIVSFARKRMNKTQFSPYKMFAVMDIIIAIILAVLSIYNIKTDDSWILSGIAGVIGLTICEPILALILLLDFIIYLINKKIKK